MTISRLLATLVTGTLLVVSPVHVASVLQSPAERIVDRFCELIALPFDSFTTVPPPVEMLDGRIRPQAVPINVTYGSGFAANPLAQAAFQHAINIWQTQLTTSVPVSVAADFGTLPAGVLAQAGFIRIGANFSGATFTNTWFPGPIVNALAGSIVSAGPQISAEFGSAFAWYFGTDGLPPSGQYDFVSVVLHELGHGLGFAGSMDVSAGLGSWGQSGLPYIYDRYVRNGSNQALIDTGLFPNPSAALAAQLTSNNLFWTGSQGVAANGGVTPKLYAPTTWSGGSSIAHLDDATYPAGTANSLMTHAIGSAEAIHSPGPIVRGIFRDSGWPLDTSCAYTLSATASTIGQPGGVGTVGVTTTAGCPWTATSSASFITITGGASVTGSGIVTYSVAANTGAQRSGTITIAGQTFTLTQSAAPSCTYTLSATAFTIGAAGGIGTVGVTTTAGCAWTATTAESFITIADGTNRTGSGILNYSTAANTSAQRSGTMTIAGQTFTLTQSAAPPACAYALSATAFSIGQAGGIGTVGVTTSAGCAWTATSNSAFMTITGGASGTASGIVTYSTAANTGALRTGTLTIAGQTFTLTQGPVMSANRASLAFAATNSAGTLSNITAAQAVTVTFTGGSLAWTATPTTTWLQVTGGSATGNGSFTVSVLNAAGLPATGSVTGSVIVTSAGASNSQAVTVTLTLFASPTASAAPFGAFDTPAAGASVEGSIAVTGWALDDIEVVRVEIWRDLVAGETTPPFPGAGPSNGKVFIANAFFVNGARPDVETLYATRPFAYRAGWGYLLLTQGLWNQGNGPFTLYAFAYDKDGHSSTLGSRAITVNNAAATRPFGGIDVPSYGQTMTGSFYNFGWALTPNASPTCRIGTTQVQMAIDSGTLVPVTYGDLRTDIQGAFPTFSNSNGAGGAALVDTTTLTNGTHSIGWFVTDSCGRAEGIGSRFFTVLNGAAGSTAAGSTAAGSTAAGSTAADSAAADSTAADSAAADSALRTLGTPGTIGTLAVDVRRGLDTTLVYPSASGTRLVAIGQGERVEVVLPPAGGATYAGYQVVKGERRPLPMGSSLDAAQGIFYWQPAAGFLGAHDLEFVAVRGVRLPERGSLGEGRGPDQAIRIRAVVGTSVQAVIDTPQPVSSRFTIAGWAIDQAATTGTGIDTVHVWAYPLTGAGPIFLGVAAYGDARPDIGALFGEQFASSSFSLVVDSLASGAYDLVVYPHSAVTGDFRGAQVVRVVVPR